MVGSSARELPGSTEKLSIVMEIVVFIWWRRKRGLQRKESINATPTNYLIRYFTILGEDAVVEVIGFAILGFGGCED